MAVIISLHTFQNAAEFAADFLAASNAAGGSAILSHNAPISRPDGARPPAAFPTDGLTPAIPIPNRRSGLRRN